MQGLQQKYSVCRLCLCSGGLIDIFNVNIKRDVEPKETIEDLIQFPVEREEGFPWLICHTCEAKLTEFRLFKRRCLECKQAFDIRFRSFKPIIITPALSNCAEGKNVPITRKDSSGTAIKVVEKENGVKPCWLVASGNLYFKEEEDSPMVDNLKKGDSRSGQHALEPDDGVIVSSIIKVSRETVKAGNVVFQEEPAASESIGIEDLTDEVFQREQMEPKNTRIEDSTPLCRIVDVGQLNADQFESGAIGFEEPNGLNHVELEPLLDEDDMPKLSIAEGSRSMAMDVAPIASEADGNLDIKQEPMLWDEVTQESYVKIEPETEEEGMPELSISGVNRSTATEMGAAASKAIENQSVMQEPAYCNGAPQTLEEIRRRVCCVPLCQNSQYTPGVRFVRFPKDSRLAIQWLLRMGRMDILQGDLSQYRSCVLCMDHFAPSMICPSSGKLVSGAVPTIFSAAMIAESPLENTNCVPDTSSTQPAVISTSMKLRHNILQRQIILRQKKCSQLASTSSAKPVAGSSAVKPRVKAPRKQALSTRPELGSYVSPAEAEELERVPPKPKPVRKKHCFVPMCPNKGIKETKKLFIEVPKDGRRKKWLQAANVRDPVTATNLYCCEDHFKIEEDIINYHQIKNMRVNFLRAEPGIIPRYFDCQVGRTRVHHPKLRELSRRLNHERITDEIVNDVSLAEEEEPEPEPPKKPKPVFRRYCFVPMCPNKGIKEDEKLFIKVPKDDRREMWLQAANVRDPDTTSNLYCCEDHFEMEEDIVNYHQVKDMGVNFLRPKPGVIPSYFDCQVGRTRVHHPKLRELRRRQNHERIINELLNGVSEDSSPSSPVPSTDADQDLSSYFLRWHKNLPKALRKRESTRLKTQNLSHAEKKHCPSAELSQDSNSSNASVPSAPLPTNLQNREKEDKSSVCADLLVGGMEYDSSVCADMQIEMKEDQSSVCADQLTEEMEDDSSVHADMQVREKEDQSSVCVDSLTEEMEDKSSVGADSQIGEKEDQSSVCADSLTEEKEDKSSVPADSQMGGKEDKSSVPAHSQMGEKEDKSSVPADSQIGEKEDDSSAHDNSQTVEEEDNSSLCANSPIVGVGDDSSDVSLASQSDSCSKPEEQPTTRRKQTFDLSSRTELVCDLDD